MCLHEHDQNFKTCPIQLDFTSSALNLHFSGIRFQIRYAQPGSWGLSPPPGQNADAGCKLLQCKGFNQIVISTGLKSL
jgi:hypothetical protein